MFIPPLVILNLLWTHAVFPRSTRLCEYTGQVIGSAQTIITVSVYKKTLSLKSINDGLCLDLQWVAFNNSFSNLK